MIPGGYKETDLRKDVLCVEQVDGLYVAEDGRHHVLTEHVLGPVFSVHPEVKDLKENGPL